MEKITLGWTGFKALIDANTLFIETEYSGDYTLIAQDGVIVYKCFLDEDFDSDRTDYISNYQSKKSVSLSPVDDEGKVFTRSESRPTRWTTYFTSCGDSATLIGSGSKIKWDFSNTDNDVTPPTGKSQKRIEFNFLDAVRIKEGAIYWENGELDATLDLYIVCPNGEYYKKNDGTVTLASADTIVAHFVQGHRMLGDCPMGDELNTESSSEDIGSNYKFWVDVTVPDTNTTLRGFVSLELYRDRTVVLT